MKRITFSIVVLLALTAAEARALPLVSGNEAQERYEQNVAQRFDPYPSVGFGPEIVGGRPREYSTPRAEVLQVQKRLPPGTVNRPFGRLFCAGRSNSTIRARPGIAEGEKFVSAAGRAQAGLPLTQQRVTPWKRIGIGVSSDGRTG